MSRSECRAPRRPVLGILFLAVSILTAMSLPGLSSGRAGGPFADVWVEFWLSAFGAPAVWALIAVAALWGLAFILRWPRSWLWRMAAMIWPLVVVWDAWLVVLRLPASTLHQEGAIGYWLAGEAERFFGAGSDAQRSLALGGLSLAVTLLFLRGCLPPPLSDWTARALRFFGRVLEKTARFLARGLILLLRILFRWILRPLARLSWRASGAGGRALHRVLRALANAVVRFAVRRRRENGPAIEESAPLEEAEWTLPRARPIRRSADFADPSRGDAGAEPNPVRAELDEVRDSARQDDARTIRALMRAGSQPPARTPPRVSADSDGRTATAPLELLADPVNGDAVSPDEIRANAARLKESLANFGIHGEIGEVHPGPVITQYEFVPGAGVTVSQITSRQDDLALALRATRIRLVAPIPGKAAVGVEIPNHQPAIISFKEIVSRREFLEARSPLAIALGKDVAGRPFYAALDSMPHLLVAGTTGSGKSVCLNTLIAALLLRCDPNVLRFLLIDPKMLELTVYNGIPHLLRPVLTDSRESARALTWLTREMERRYRVFAARGVRNIEAYRRRAREDPRDEEEPLEPMPYIVVVVDELADLMMSNQSEVELPVARLAQMARAVGIHLVLATQRPSVDVITGVIKANFPARIAFQVASRTDSRTILDMNGAEALIGRGDMLFIPPGKAQAHRVHGAYISDGEIEGLAAYLRQFPPPEPLANPIDAEEESDPATEIEDPLFDQALRIVVGSQQGSTSFLQRRLRIGYTRAGRLMDMLERAGVVGPPDGSRARDVLMSPEALAAEQSRTDSD